VRGCSRHECETGGLLTTDGGGSEHTVRDSKSPEDRIEGAEIKKQRRIRMQG
jgi:hypothetical protein